MLAVAEEGPCKEAVDARHLVEPAQRFDVFPCILLHVGVLRSRGRVEGGRKEGGGGGFSADKGGGGGTLGRPSALEVHCNSRQ